MISVTDPSALLVIVSVTESTPRTNEITWSPNWMTPLSCAFSPKMTSVIWVASDESNRLCKVRRNCDAGSCELIALGSLRSEEHTSELQSLMRISYAVFYLTPKKRPSYITTRYATEHTHCQLHTASR